MTFANLPLLVALLSLVTSFLIVCWGWGYFIVDVTKTVNNNKLAVKSFLGLFRSAEHIMSIYDDGDNKPESVYQNQDVIKTVRKKLDDNPNFKVQCLFNVDEGTEFAKQLRDYPKQVEIKIREGERPNIAHYKIIDGGKKVYLSWHEMGNENRNVKVYDFSRLKPRRWWQADVKQDYIGEYLEDNRRAFAESC